jgi:hypothetical protein
MREPAVAVAAPASSCVPSLAPRNSGPSIRRHWPAPRARRRRHMRARWLGSSSDTEKLRPGRTSRRQPGGSGTTSSHTFWKPPVDNRSARSRRLLSWPAAIDAPIRQHRHVTSLMLCAGYSAGQSRRGWSRLIRRLASTTRRGRRPICIFTPKQRCGLSSMWFQDRT